MEAFAVEQLKWSLQALAQPAHIQQTLFPDFVALADELALDFDNWYKATKWREIFTSDQRSALVSIDELLEQMSGATNSQFWETEALSSRSEWQEVRRLSVCALQSFGWSVKRPPSSRSTYVDSDQGS